MDARKLRKDTALRRRLWRAIATTTLIGAALLLGLEFWLRQMAGHGAAQTGRALWQLSLAAALINLALIAVAALLARCLLDWGRQTREQGQWPPAGLDWPGQNPIRHGQDALRIAKRLTYAGIAAIVLAAGVAAATALRWLA
ncbi:MAG: hypothetical protein KA196_01555 [Arenimonas sp.]|nr:hypothetical protein [Arenimonas sp.]